MKRTYWLGAGAIAVLIAVVVGLRGLRQGPSNDYLPEDEQTALESGLTLRDVTLEQPDELGNLLWRVTAEEVTYSPDNRNAQVTQPRGELYQDGELLYRVQAREGEIQENGDVMVLRGNIVATGVQNRAVLRGEELEWRAQSEVMLVRDQVTGTHPQLRATAAEARVYDRANRIELLGGVVANTVVEDPQTEPWIKLQAKTLHWRWEAEEVESYLPLRVERFLNEKITEVTTSDRGLVDLAANRVTLTNSVLVQLLDLSLKLASDRAVWNVAEEQILVNEALRLESEPQAVTVTAEQGRLELGEDTVYLNQEVVAVSRRNDGRLSADRLVWNVAAQTILAEGSVNYRQSNPALTVRGPRALGRIEAQTVTVSGGQVVTEIQPQ
jgi:LPS export ABC transporter protein LptC